MWITERSHHCITDGRFDELNEAGFIVEREEDVWVYLTELRQDLEDGELLRFISEEDALNAERRVDDWMNRTSDLTRRVRELEEDLQIKSTQLDAVRADAERYFQQRNEARRLRDATYDENERLKRQRDDAEAALLQVGEHLDAIEFPQEMSAARTSILIEALQEIVTQHEESKK